jgi:flagellar hook-basal body complex protein FliE
MVEEVMSYAMSAVRNASSSIAGANGSATGAGPSSSLGSSQSGKAGSTPFGDLLTNAIGQVNSLESQARTAVDGLMTGTGVDVHQAMIATQKADMAFELVLAVHNKAVQAYQQVMGLQF